MSNSVCHIPHNLHPAENIPALCVLPMRSTFYLPDTPDWPLTNGFRSDLCSNFRIAPEMAMLCLAPALATVVQTIADVERPNGLVGPTSVWSCVIADPSSRKSTTDNAVNKPIHFSRDKLIKVAIFRRNSSFYFFYPMNLCRTALRQTKFEGGIHLLIVNYR